MADRWLPLPLRDWKPTYATLHMWTQIVGKICLASTPLVNHFWNVAFRVTARGFGTPTLSHATGPFQIEFDFIDHRLIIDAADGRRETLRLEPMTVRAFHERLMATLARMRLDVKIWPVPVEIPDPIPFTKDEIHGAYDPEQAHRSWRVFAETHRVLSEFRAGFIGKCSPVHFFWGSFDLAVTRFSGRRAPERPGADAITRESYSHEVISHGFWPGSGGIEDAAFYAYAAPEPEGFRSAAIRPAAARYEPAFGEYVLMYEDVRRSAAPERMLRDFLDSTYDAGATLAHWSRMELERH
jgi:uncharacterized protein DUF5996